MGNDGHDDVIKWKHFPRFWPFVRVTNHQPYDCLLNSGADQRIHQSSASLAFVRGFHRGPVNSPHKGQWRRALMFSLICVWINGWVNNSEAGDLRRHRGHYDVNVMGDEMSPKILLLINQGACGQPIGEHHMTIFLNLPLWWTGTNNHLWNINRKSDIFIITAFHWKYRRYFVINDIELYEIWYRCHRTSYCE